MHKGTRIYYNKQPGVILRLLKNNKAQIITVSFDHASGDFEYSVLTVAVSKLLPRNTHCSELPETNQ